MADINFAVLISRWLHLGAVAVAVGGAVFLRFVLIPSARSVLDDKHRESLEDAVRGRWLWFVNVSIGLLIVTGFLNFFLLAIAPKVDPFPYHAIFGAKFLTALFVFFIASVLVGRSAKLSRFRGGRELWLNVMLVAMAVIFLLSGLLSQIRAQSPGAVSDKSAITAPLEHSVTP